MSSMVSMRAIWSPLDDTVQSSSRAAIEEPQGPEPQTQLDKTELRDMIGEAIARLPEREKLVITLYYYEELTLREIGEVLGVTESRVSQLHTKAVLRLKSRLLGDPLAEGE